MSDSVTFTSTSSSVASQNTSGTVAGAASPAVASVVACGVASLLLLAASTAPWFQVDDLFGTTVAPSSLQLQAVVLGLVAGVLAGVMMIGCVRRVAAIIAIILGTLSFGSTVLTIALGLHGFSNETLFGTEVVHLQPQSGVILAALGTAALAIGGVAAVVAGRGPRPHVDPASWVRPTAGT